VIDLKVLEELGYTWFEHGDKVTIMWDDGRLIDIWPASGKWGYRNGEPPANQGMEPLLKRLRESTGKALKAIK